MFTVLPESNLDWRSSIIVGAGKCAESYSAMLAMRRKEIVYCIDSVRIAEGIEVYD